MTMTKRKAAMKKLKLKQRLANIKSDDSENNQNLPLETTKEKSNEKLKKQDKPVFIKKTILRDNIRDKLKNKKTLKDDLL